MTISMQMQITCTKEKFLPGGKTLYFPLPVSVVKSLKRGRRLGLSLREGLKVQSVTSVNFVKSSVTEWG